MVSLLQEEVLMVSLLQEEVLMVSLSNHEQRLPIRDDV